jgi:hypothetical protein
LTEFTPINHRKSSEISKVSSDVFPQNGKETKRMARDDREIKTQFFQSPENHAPAPRVILTDGSCDFPKI